MRSESVEKTKSFGQGMKSNDASSFRFKDSYDFKTMSNKLNSKKCSSQAFPDDMKYKFDFYKTNFCNFYSKGKCLNGENCRFAHGISELRRPLIPKQKGKAKAQNNKYAKCGGTLDLAEASKVVYDEAFQGGGDATAGNACEHKTTLDANDTCGSSSTSRAHCSSHANEASENAIALEDDLLENINDDDLLDAECEDFEFNERQKTFLPINEFMTKQFRLPNALLKTPVSLCKENGLTPPKTSFAEPQERNTRNFFSEETEARDSRQPLLSPLDRPNGYLKLTIPPIRIWLQEQEGSASYAHHSFHPGVYTSAFIEAPGGADSRGCVALTAIPIQASTCYRCNGLPINMALGPNNGMNQTENPPYSNLYMQPSSIKGMSKFNPANDYVVHPMYT